MRRTELKPGKPLERRTELNRASQRAKRRNRRRRRLVAAELERRPWCEIRWDPNCGRRAQGFHEPRTRARFGPETILDLARAEATCDYCHGAVHLHPEEAERRGHLVPSWED